LLSDDYGGEFQQRLEVTGTKPIGGVESFVVSDSQAQEEYFSFDSAGLVNQGAASNEGPPGTTPSEAPYPELPFPIRVCSAFQQFKSDGQTQTAIEWSIGDVTVSQIPFHDVLELDRKLERVYRIGLGAKVSTVWTATDWYAPGFGHIKSTVIAGDTRSDYDITGALLGGVGYGVLPGGNIAQLDEAETFLTGDDRPATAWDGARFLVASGTSTSSSAGGLSVSLVGPDGTTASTTTVAGGSVPVAPAAAWGGDRYLVAYDIYNSSPKAVLLDASGAQQGKPFDIVGAGPVAVAYGRGVFLVVSAQAQGLTISVVPPAGGVTSEVIPYPMPTSSHPAIAFDGEDFLLTWLSGNVDSTHVWAGRVNADGNAIDVKPTQVTAAPPLQEQVDVTFDGVRYVLAWFDRANVSTIGEGDVRIARVGVDGTLLDPGGRVVAPGRKGTSKNGIRIGHVGPQAFVVWQRIDYQSTGPSTWIGGTRVDAEGNALDSSATSDGLFISMQAGPGAGSAPINPEMVWGGDRALVAFVDRAGESMNKRTINGSLIYPWTRTAGAPDGGVSADDAGGGGGGADAADGGVCSPRRCGVEIACGVAADGCGGSVTCDPCPDVAQMLRLPGARHLVVDHGRDLVYVTTPGNNPTYPNSVVVIAPTATTPKVVTALPVGAEPNMLALSDDGTRLWVGTDGDYSIRKIELGTGAPVLGAETKLPHGYNYLGDTRAGSMQALHGSADSVVVALMNNAGTYVMGLIVLDDAIPRAPAIYTHATVIAVGDGDAVFGANGADTGFDFYTLQVSSQGLTQMDYPSILTSFARSLIFAHGRVYADGGDVIDVSTPANIGNLGFGGAVRPLPNDATRVLTLAGGPVGGDAVLKSVDATTFQTKKMVSIAGVSGYVRDLDILGTDSIVFIADEGTPTVSDIPNRVVIARTSLLP
jgi:hypothetical protein